MPGSAQFRRFTRSINMKFCFLNAVVHGDVGSAQAIAHHAEEQRYIFLSCVRSTETAWRNGKDLYSR